MVKVSYDELKKAVDQLGENCSGRDVTVYISGSKLELKSMDDYAHEVTVCMHDVQYPLKPTLTKKEYL